MTNEKLKPAHTYLEMALGGNMNTDTLTQFAWVELMEGYANYNKPTELEQKWLELAPEFGEDKYEYLFKIELNRDDDCNYSEWEWWNDTKWIQISQMAHRLVYATVIRRPVAPVWKVGDKAYFRTNPKSNGGTIVSIDGEMAWIRWHEYLNDIGGTYHTVEYLDILASDRAKAPTQSFSGHCPGCKQMFADCKCPNPNA